METRVLKRRRCKKCGKIITYTLVEDDGRDWMGHHWGKEKTYTVGYDCDCEGPVEKIRVWKEE